MYRAREIAFDRSVAVKVFGARLTGEEVVREFRRECLAIGQVGNHPNIVRVFSAGRTGDGRPYLTMELMEGSLADTRGAEPSSPADVVRIGVALAGALVTAHRAGVLHRDVKPANVLVDAYGHYALADFGVSTVASRTTTESPLGLTVQHAAPEVLRGELATEASDVYSLGSTLYQLVSGRAPFSSPTGEPAAAMAKMVEDRPPRIENSGPPVGLEAALLRSLERDPQHRTQTMLQFGRELEGVADELGIAGARMVLSATGSAMPDSASTEADGGTHDAKPAPGGRTSGRTPVRWAVGVGALVLVVALAVAGIAARGSGSGADAAASTTTEVQVDQVELVQVVAAQVQERVPAIMLNRSCVLERLNQLSAEALRFMVAAGAGSRSNVDTTGDVIERCPASYADVPGALLSGELTSTPPRTDEAIRPCVEERLADEGISDLLAVAVLTEKADQLVVDRVAADRVAVAAFGCMTNEQQTEAVLARLQEDAQVDEATHALLRFCLASGPPDHLESSESTLALALVDTGRFPEQLRTAYDSVLRDASLAFLTDPNLVIEGEPEGERTCMASESVELCEPIDPAAFEPEFC